MAVFCKPYVEGSYYQLLIGMGTTKCSLFAMESENTESWSWFITLLIDDLKLKDGRGLTIMSDQPKELERAVKYLLPTVEHRFCTRHILSNFKQRYDCH